jgi:hypothetical protein
MKQTQAQLQSFAAAKRILIWLLPGNEGAIVGCKAELCEDRLTPAPEGRLILSTYGIAEAVR